MFRETILISSALIYQNLDNKISEPVFYLDADYTIVAQEYMEQKYPKPKDINDILYDIIAQELLNNPR